MALDLTYVAQGATFTLHLSGTDVEVCSHLREMTLKEEVDTIFNVSDFGEVSRVERLAVIKAIDSLVATAKTNPGVFPHAYVVKQEYPAGSGKYYGGTGTIAGFISGGERFAIEGGLGHCFLYKQRLDQDGQYRYDHEHPIDARNMKRIARDEASRDVGGLVFGDILITKRKVHARLIARLTALREFLLKAEGEIVEKCLG